MTQADDHKEARGKLIIISGPSGVGKSTITREVIDRLEEAYLSVSMTTRPQAPSEQDGREYWFVSRDEFRRRIEEGSFLEYAEVFGNLYGTPRDKTDEALRAGKTVILEIDVQGAKQVKAMCPQVVMIFILPPSDKVLAERMGHRGRESAEAAKQRLDKAGSEIAAARQCYDKMVINDDLEQAVKEVVRIIRQTPAVDRKPDTDQELVGER